MNKLQKKNTFGKNSEKKKSKQTSLGKNLCQNPLKNTWNNSKQKKKRQ